MNLKKRKRNKKTIKLQMSIKKRKCTSEERFGRRNFEKISDDDERTK